MHFVSRWRTCSSFFLSSAENLSSCKSLTTTVRALHSYVCGNSTSCSASTNIGNKMIVRFIFLWAMQNMTEPACTHWSGQAPSDWDTRPTSPRLGDLLRLSQTWRSSLKTIRLIWFSAGLPHPDMFSPPYRWKFKTRAHSKCIISLVISPVPISDSAGCSLLSEKGAEK